MNIFFIQIQKKNNANLTSLVTFGAQGQPVSTITKLCSFMIGSLFLQWTYFPSNQNLSSEEIFHYSRITVRSSSSLLIIIEAIAPSLNSKEVPPSTTMQASQQRDRTHTLSRKKHLINIKFSLNYDFFKTLKL